MRYPILASALVCAGLIAGAPAQAQQGPLPYGTAVTLGQAKTMAAAAEAHAHAEGLEDGDRRRRAERRAGLSREDG